MNHDSHREVIESAPPKASAFKVRGLRWWMMALLMLGSILNYLTRQTLSVAQVELKDTLGISEAEYSWITGAFQITLMLQPFCGYVLDVIGLRIGLALFVVAWSLINMAHALAGSWKGLAFLRGLMGFAEGSANPAGMKATAQWYPARERGLAAGLYNIGASAGMMLAPPLVAFSVIYLNWQSAFVISGGLGLVWVGLWLLLYQSPSRHRWLSEPERDYIAAGQEKSLGYVGKPSVGEIIRQRNFWGIALPRFLADPTWGALSFWLPLYLAKERHFNLKEIALFVWLPFLAADFGCVFGGLLAATFQKRLGVSLINGRRLAFTAGAALMVSVAFAGWVDDPYVAILLLSLGGFAHQTLSVTVITMSSDLFRRSEVATVAGMAGTCGNAGVLVFTLIVGALVAQIGYSPFFVGLSILDIIGAIVLWTLVRERRDDPTPGYHDSVRKAGSVDASSSSIEEKQGFKPGLGAGDAAS
jgi:ACS family hexuronate transporter-like MFS transporter